MELTEKEADILNFILNFKLEKGYPPTIREIGKALSLSSPASVHFHLNNLEKKGFIKRFPGHRGLEVKMPALREVKEGMVEVPVVGRISAGVPTFSAEEIERFISFPQEIAREGCFFLKAEGESMIEAGILPGDYLLMKPVQEVKNGDIVVAMIDDETTVKRFKKRGKKVFLEPANSRMKPREMREGRIIGKVIAVYRILE